MSIKSSKYFNVVVDENKQTYYIVESKTKPKNESDPPF